MPTIKYADYTNGDDNTGDGTTGTPYKTIDKASTGLTGGDEVRVAKSADPTALTGTIAFTAGSTAITGTDTLFTSELAVGDFVKGGDDQWYEVVTITNNTNAVLFRVYPSTTAGTVSSYKLGVTSTGEAAAAATAIQTISASGSSAESRLKISGGWDLTGPTQDGQTYFRQMHGTFSNRYGRGLYSSSKNYIEIDHLHFLRYDNCIYMSSNNYCKITSPNLLSAGDEAWYMTTCGNNEIISPVVNSSNNNGIYMTGCKFNTITDPICNANNGPSIYIFNASTSNTITNPTCNYNDETGIYIYSSANCTITTPTCNNNTNGNGIYVRNSNNCLITSPVCNNNQYVGLYLYQSSDNTTITSPTLNSNNQGLSCSESYNNVANNLLASGNSNADVVVSDAKEYGDYPALKCQKFGQTTGDNRCYYEYGVTYRDTADARSTQCLKYDPTSATDYISQSFFFKADSGVAQTLSAYIKKEAAFNGDVQGAIFFMGVKITGWTTLTPTENDTYEQKSLVAAAGDITEDGVLELRIKVRGTAGNVFVDDLATA